MLAIFNVFIVYYNIASVLCFGFFGHEACGIFAPRSGIEPKPSTLEAWSLNQWTAR